ncbi:hypothetical protein CHU98_g5433 [Xylaria longipes]|nr:hypothetical protein CHU98_g5433 [Xylaria longipes]
MREILEVRELLSRVYSDQSLEVEEGANGQQKTLHHAKQAIFPKSDYLLSLYGPLNAPVLISVVFVTLSRGRTAMGLYEQAQPRLRNLNVFFAKFSNLSNSVFELSTSGGLAMGGRAGVCILDLVDLTVALSKSEGVAVRDRGNGDFLELLLFMLVIVDKLYFVHTVVGKGGAGGGGVGDMRVNNFQNPRPSPQASPVDVELDPESLPCSPTPVSYGCVLFPGSGDDLLLSRRTHSMPDFFHRRLNIEGPTDTLDSISVCWMPKRFTAQEVNPSGLLRFETAISINTELAAHMPKVKLLGTFPYASPKALIDGNYVKDKYVAIRGKDPHLALRQLTSSHALEYRVPGIYTAYDDQLQSMIKGRDPLVQNFDKRCISDASHRVVVMQHLRKIIEYRVHTRISSEQNSEEDTPAHIKAAGMSVPRMPLVLAQAKYDKAFWV